jgi:hypothetical protein
MQEVNKKRKAAIVEQASAVVVQYRGPRARRRLRHKKPTAKEGRRVRKRKELALACAAFLPRLSGLGGLGNAGTCAREMLMFCGKVKVVREMQKKSAG